MPNHALAILTGHLGRDPELKYLTNGKPVLRFSIGVNTGYGERKVTTWWKCTCFGERYAKIAGYLAKGKPVTAIGEPSTRSWTADNGTIKVEAELLVNDIVLLSTGNGQAEPHIEQAAAMPAAEPQDANIPF